MDGDKQTMRGVIVIIAIICLLAPGCSNQYTPSFWDYKSPEHVRCQNVEMKYCKAYGARMICECIA